MHYEDADASDNKRENKTDSAASTLINPGENPLRSYRINTQRDTVLHIGASVIRIPKNSFADSAGNMINGEAELQYREFHSVPEILLSGIPMDYDSAGTNYFFESAGMFEINAAKQGHKLLLAPGKNIEVQMASLNSDTAKFNQYYYDEANKTWQALKKDEVIILKQPEIKKILAKKSDKTKGESDMPAKPRLAQRGRDQFMIEIPKRLYPELELFTNVVFEVSGNDKRLDRQALNKTWSTVTLDKAGDGESYLVSFRKNAELYQVVARPVFDTNNYKPALEKYNLLCAEIRKKMKDSTLTKKKPDTDTESAKYLETVKEYNELMKRYQIYYADSAKSAAYKASKEELTLNIVYRSFQVNRLGIWNSDCAQNLPDGITLTCSYEDESGVKMVPRGVYLLMKNKNVVVACSDPNKVKCDLHEKNTLIILAEGNVLCWVKSEDFPVTSVPIAHTFIVQTLHKDHYTIRDIEKIIL